MGGGTERRIANAHTDIHSNEKRHFTTQRGSTFISQTHLCHPVFPYTIKNISKVCFSHILLKLKTVAGGTAIRNSSNGYREEFIMLVSLFLAE